MKFLRRLYCLLDFHAHAIRERREGVLHFTCECGHAVPAIGRDGAPVTVFRPAFESMKARPSQPATVSQFQKRSAK